MFRCLKIVMLVIILALPIYAGSIDEIDSGLLSDGGIIRGTVFSSGGETIQRALVILYSSHHTVIDSIIADYNGQFSFAVESDEYFVSAEAFDYIKRFYPDEYMFSSAEPITVFPSQIVNISFDLEHGGAICGQIYTGNGQQSDFVVSVVKVDFPYENWQCDKTFQITYQGNYYIDGLLPGYYKAFVRAEGYQMQFYPDVETFKEAEIIQVITGNVTNGIDFMLEQPGDGLISGYVMDIYSNIPVDEAMVLAYNWHQDSDGPNLVSAFTDENGYYEMEVTAGHYYVEVIIENDVYLGNDIHLYYNNRFDPKLADLVHVESSEIIQEVNFDYDSSLTYNLNISGELYNYDNGYPLEGVRLIAIDYYSGQQKAYCYSVTNGAFNISNLVSGSYLIQFEGNNVITGFWPNAYNWQEAEIVVLTTTSSDLYNGGAITQDYGTPGLSIAGAVNGPYGPLANVRLYAINNENGKIAFARTNPSGTYNISSGLHEGAYSVFADLYGYNGTYYPYTLHLDLIENPRLENIDFYLEPVTVDIGTEVLLPGENRLLGNFPNPFNISTVILFSAQTQFNSNLEVYNLCGQLIRTLPVSAKPGINSIYWDGRNSDNSTIASGLYFYKIENLPETRKMVILK